MERFGFIHDKLDIKLLILYILKMLPLPIAFSQLPELVLIDGGFDYFEFTQCLYELVASGHVLQDGDNFIITEIGAEHCETVESSIPFSVRSKAQQIAEPLIEKMKRDALIGTSHKPAKDGGCIMKLSLSDGIGDILKLNILTSDEEQAEVMEKNFRENAESIYHQIITLLTPERK